MDEASKLVSELQGKLAELDHKVWQYRRDMATEFTKYAEDLLRTVSIDISETVSRAIAESMKDYESLNLATGAIDSCAIGNNSRTVEYGVGIHRPQGAPASIPIAQRRGKEETEGSPRSPHEREKEFQGLFTPSYLPLLDSTDRNERRASYDRRPTPPPDTKAKGKEVDMEIEHVDASTDTRSLLSTPEPLRPPTPRRKNTDEVSVNSDLSDSVTRRSALRRSSSSSNKQSPRRVRFDVEGEEVLPTSSPVSFEKAVAKDIPGASRLLGEDSEDEAGSEQIEDVEDPPPKRISSSQALRALSRSPLVDDGTQWTTVSAPPDGSASVAVSGALSNESSSENLPHLPHLPPTNGFSRHDIGDYPLGNSEETKDYSYGSMALSRSDVADEDTSSDEDMLDMPPLKSMRGQKSSAAATSPITSSFENNRSQTTATGPPIMGLGLDTMGGEHSSRSDKDLRFDEEDEEEVFQFDEHIERQGPPDENRDNSGSPSPTSSVTNDNGSGKVSGSLALPVPPSAYSQSPAREIPKPPSQRKPTSQSNDVVGSLKGNAFSFPIVSPDVHAAAAKLGNITSFVGSVDGRSGMDASDNFSYRNSGGMGSFSGTPRSMSERMMMDELIEAEAERQEKAQGRNSGRGNGQRRS
ncbi:hypothetical protein BGZ60DRAFT_436101 [Tricladium varicosporioides]|nr:hypothetical protein BGZ60DRAFT_436101 [Hymenoscyphus varicosporioides]